MAGMFCRACGAENAGGIKYCSACGKRLPTSVRIYAPAAAPREIRRRSEWSLLQWSMAIILIIGAILAAMAISSGINTEQSADPTGAWTPSVPATPTTTIAEFAASASRDTYAQVSNHPDDHQGDAVVWTCQVDRFLGPDSNQKDNTDIGCSEIVGTYARGIGDGEIVINVPPSIRMSSIGSGDDITVYGTVDQPIPSIDSFGAIVIDPMIDAVYLVDHKHYAIVVP